jgi:endonuclease IV
MNYKNLGSHVSLSSVKELEKYTDTYQICLGDPKLFISDFKRLDTEAFNWSKYIQKGTVVCHGPYNTNIICNNRNLLQSLSSLSHTVRVCIKHKIKFLVVHPGVLAYLDSRSDKEAIKYAKSFIERYFLKYNGVDILFENLACLRSLKLDSLYDIVKDYSNMGLCIDTNHAFGRGENWKLVKKYLRKNKTKVIHLNAVPKGLVYGSGIDVHARTSLCHSYGICPEELKEIVINFPDKVKIMEQYPKFAIKSFKYLEKS